MERIKFNSDLLPIIKIYCSVEKRVPSYIISKFFEFTGTYASVELIETQTSEIKGIENIPTFYLSTELPFYKDERVCYINTSVEPWNNVTLENCSLDILGGVNEEGKSNAFLPIIEYMKLVTEEFPVEVYSELWNIFIDNDMVEPLMQLEFKPDIIDYHILQFDNRKVFCGKELIFLKLSHYLFDILYPYNSKESSIKGSFQFEFAKLFFESILCCIDLCRIDMERISEEIQIEIEDYRQKFGITIRFEIVNKKFYSILKLPKKRYAQLIYYWSISNFVGNLMFSSIDFDLADEWPMMKRHVLFELTVKTFKEVLNRDFEKFESEILYTYAIKDKLLFGEIEAFEWCLECRYMNWIGELLEKKEFTYENTYQAALIVLFHRYKGKLILVPDDAYYDAVTRYFEQSMELLKIYLKGEINPKEMKFYLSDLCYLCKLYLKFKNWEDTIRFGSQALQFFEDVISNINYYVPIYGASDAKKEMDLIMQEQKFIVKSLYETLAIAHLYRGDIGDKELREYYQELY